MNSFPDYRKKMISKYWGLVLLLTVELAPRGSIDKLVLCIFRGAILLIFSNFVRSILHIR